MKSDHVFILTTTTNTQIANMFAWRLQEIGIHIHVCSELQEQRLFCTSARIHDVAIILTYSAISDHLQENVRMLYRRNVPILLISSMLDRTLPHYAKHRLLLSGKEALADKIATFSSSISAQYLFDLIFAKIYQKNYDSYAHSRNLAYMTTVK